MSVALAAPHAEAVAAGRAVADAGGNALDAALAAAAMLTVVYPHQCAIGGDLIALVRSPRGETRAVISAGTAPAAILEASADWSAMPRTGVHPITVPGMLAGWCAIAALGATRRLGEHLARAAETAERGTPVTRGLERAIDAQGAAIAADPGLRGVLSHDGAPLRASDVLRQPALARTLRALAEDPDVFYRGDIAARLVDFLRSQGGTHAVSDFAAYAPVVEAPLMRDIGGREWAVAGAPSVGPLLLGIATAAQGDPAELVSASIRGVAARGAHLGDPAFGGVDVEALLDLMGDDAPRDEPIANGDTASVTAVDSEGWAVTIVQSVFQTFGAGLLDPDTGVLFHNRGGGFSLEPGSPAELRPGARPPHTLCPAIVSGDDLLVVAGCQGGRAQPWILGQLLPSLVEPAADPLEILGRPRWVIGDRDLGFEAFTYVTEPGIDPALAARAEEAGLDIASWPGPDDRCGHVNVVRSLPGGVLDAASDPRADGLGVVTAS
ncbi:gamma-glutamyltransferase [Microbacterium indicum]|uniref:gamma-glutamyltransferase n=1 Tax=Microbacterium indicum TaxID=358100 RepID=UPI0003FF69D5|nr:gamma-glutamyltransferase [Microbacterium indicum]